MAKRKIEIESKREHWYLNSKGEDRSVDIPALVGWCG